MIKLEQPVTTFWHPQGDATGNPFKVAVDRFSILLCRTDLFSRHLEISAAYGYVVDGEFKIHMQANGVINLTSLRLVEGDEFDVFLDTIARKGAPRGSFRITDVEELILAKKIVEGGIE